MDENMGLATAATDAEAAIVMRRVGIPLELPLVVGPNSSTDDADSAIKREELRADTLLPEPTT